MALDTPTTKEISDNIVAQLEASLNQTVPLLPKSFIRVLAKALSGVFILLYKFGGFIFLQIFVSTASAKPVTVNGKTVIPLVEWGRTIGLGDPALAVSAEYTVEIDVKNQTGSLPSGSQLIRSETGVIYITKAAVFLNAPTVQVDVVAASDQSGGTGAGTIGNLELGDELNFVNPLANVETVATVVTELVTGVDGEDLETEYRQRVDDFFKKRPQGGAYADYEAWGEEVSGVINVYPYTGQPGEVDVYSEVSTDIDPDGIPPQAILDAVLDSINLDQNGLASRRPANAWVNSLPITRKGFDVAVFDLIVDDLPGVSASIEAALQEYFLEREPFIDGLSILPKKNKITSTGVSAIVNDIVDAAGGVFVKAEVYETGQATPISEYILDDGEKSKLVNFSVV
jgi:hypothetical protein